MADGTVKLMSGDGHEFEVSTSIADMMETIKAAVEDTGGDVVPIANVEGKPLEKVIEYCDFLQNKSHTMDPDERENWLKEFFGLEYKELFKVILAANFLNCQPLLDASTAFVADQIRGKSPEDIRNMFNIRKDFSSPEEERECREKYQWREKTVGK